jgi:hypothetical protein
MSVGNWLKNAPASIGLILITLFIGMAWTNSASQNSEKNELASKVTQTGGPNRTKLTTEWVAETCAVADRAPLDDPSGHLKGDLCAQFRAAAAAEASAALAQSLFIFAFLGAAGLLFTLFLSLRASDTAAKAVSASAEALDLQRQQLARIQELFILERRGWARALRPRPRVYDPETGSSLIHSRTGISVAFELRFKNEGKSPIYGLRPFAHLSVDDSVQHVSKTLASEIAADIDPGAAEMGYILFPGEEASWGMELSLSMTPAWKNVISPLIRGWLDYHIWGDGGPHHTPFLFNITRVDPGHGPHADYDIHISDGDLTPDQIRIQPVVFGPDVSAT